MEIPRDIVEKLAKDPEYLQRAIRSEDLDSFKNLYGVSGSSRLRCPACNQYGQSGGSLWGPKEGTTNVYVCRKCELMWQIECLTRPTGEVIQGIKNK